MSKSKVTVPLIINKKESEITFVSTRQLFGWIVRHPKAKLIADKKGNWIIKLKA